MGGYWATHHLSFDKEMFITYEKVEHIVPLFLDNFSTSKVEGFRNVTLKFLSSKVLTLT